LHLADSISLATPLPSLFSKPYFFLPMNTPKIAALYTPYVAQLLSIPTPESHNELLRTLLLKREDNSLVGQWEIRVRDFDPQTVDFEQRCSQRVHAWAIKQFPETDHKQLEGEVWSAMAADFSSKPAKGDFLLRFSSKQDFATLLRGMQHYQHKLDRQTKKLVAQLYAYHHVQCVNHALTVALVEQMPQPRFISLRRRLAAKVQQVATAAQTILFGEGQAV
jgi:hypothetical protein